MAITAVQKKWVRECRTAALFILSMAALSLCLSSCHTATRVVEVEKTVNDTLNTISSRRDSIHIHDSIVISVKGDTVFRDRWHTVYKEVAKTDTVTHILRVHTPYTVEVAKPVPYIPMVGKVFIAIGVLALLALLAWLAWRFRRK